MELPYIEYRLEACFASSLGTGALPKSRNGDIGGIHADLGLIYFSGGR